MSEQNSYMGDDYYRYPTGNEEHYAAYKKQFETEEGVRFPVPDDPRESYEIDNAYELAYDRYAESGEWPPSPDLTPWPGKQDPDHEDPEPELDGWFLSPAAAGREGGPSRRAGDARRRFLAMPPLVPAQW